MLLSLARVGGYTAADEGLCGAVGERATVAATPGAKPGRAWWWSPDIPVPYH